MEREREKERERDREKQIRERRDREKIKKEKGERKKGTSPRLFLIPRWSVSRPPGKCPVLVGRQRRPLFFWGFLLCPNETQGRNDGKETIKDQQQIRLVTTMEAKDKNVCVFLYRFFSQFLFQRAPLKESVLPKQ